MDGCSSYNFRHKLNARIVQLSCHNDIDERSNFADANRDGLTADNDAEFGLRGRDFASDGAIHSLGCAALQIMSK
jgi:hypothetical protein